jgi:hypothetical protein
MQQPQSTGVKVFSRGSDHVIGVDCGRGEELRRRLESLGLRSRVRKASGRDWVEVKADPDALKALVDDWGR